MGATAGALILTGTAASPGREMAKDEEQKKRGSKEERLVIEGDPGEAVDRLLGVERVNVTIHCRSIENPDAGSETEHYLCSVEREDGKGFEVRVETNRTATAAWDDFAKDGAPEAVRLAFYYQKDIDGGTVRIGFVEGANRAIKPYDAGGEYLGVIPEPLDPPAD